MLSTTLFKLFEHKVLYWDLQISYQCTSTVFMSHGSCTWEINFCFHLLIYYLTCNVSVPWEHYKPGLSGYISSYQKLEHWCRATSWDIELIFNKAVIVCLLFQVINRSCFPILHSLHFWEKWSIIVLHLTK